MTDYTLVLGVDGNHLDQLWMVWQTWAMFKPSLLTRRVVIFYDRYSVHPDDIASRMNPKPSTIDTHAWPPEGITPSHYITLQSTQDKWHSPQRAMMLSGFVHVPAVCVDTKYWLKLDLDVVATGMDDWIDPDWFKDKPAIVSHPWGYTKPADQMDKLDAWVHNNVVLPTFRSFFLDTRPLDLHPIPGSTLLSHPRIISWCSFWRTDFTAVCSALAMDACGIGRLPVPSQDGYMWYMATRLGQPIVRPRMKVRGWEHHNGNANVQRAVDRVFTGVKN